ncbi:MAG: hypothetical protein D6778_06010 [Nitrospirae bacterium]|nr:MAG: hypothetical protein D6778_06010 [Nitrospirota bacterium]
MQQNKLNQKKTAILEHGRGFLQRLTERCINECSKALIPFGVPVFKRFLKYRSQRELELNAEALEMAEILHTTGATLSEEDLEELLETSRTIDKKLQRDILLLPIRVHFDYDTIVHFRKKRLELLTGFFKKLLDTCQDSYKEMVRKAMSKDQYLDVNTDVVELYAEEAYEINLSIRTPIKVDLKPLAERIHCSMIEVGVRILQEEAEDIFST